MGKTSLIRRYVLDTFDDKYITTIGTKVSKKVLKYPKTDARDSTDLTLMIWDIIGQRGLPQLHSMYFKGASAGFLVCDMTRKSTLEALTSWRDEFFATVGRVPLVILVNKSDLKSQAQMTKDDIEGLTRSIGAMYFLTSAKSGLNVEKSFYAIGKLQLDKKLTIGGGTGDTDLTFSKKPEGKKKVKIKDKESKLSDEERLKEKKKRILEKKRKEREGEELELRKKRKLEKKRRMKEAEAGAANGERKKKKKKKKKKKEEGGDTGDMDFGALDDVEDWG